MSSSSSQLQELQRTKQKIFKKAYQFYFSHNDQVSVKGGWFGPFRRPYDPLYPVLDYPGVWPIVTCNHTHWKGTRMRRNTTIAVLVVLLVISNINRFHHGTSTCAPAGIGSADCDITLEYGQALVMKVDKIQTVDPNFLYHFYVQGGNLVINSSGKYHLKWEDGQWGIVPSPWISLLNE